MVMRSLLTEDRASVKIGSCCCGIPIALHYSYFLLLLIVVAASARYLDAAFSLFMLTLYGPVLLLTIVIVSVAAHDPTAGHLDLHHWLIVSCAFIIYL